MDTIESKVRYNAERPSPGDIFLASVGTGKIRPIVVISCEDTILCYYECTTRRKEWLRQVPISGCGFIGSGYIMTNRSYAEDIRILCGKIGRLPWNIFSKLVSGTGSPVKKTGEMFQMRHRRVVH